MHNWLFNYFLKLWQIYTCNTYLLNFLDIFKLVSYFTNTITIDRPDCSANEISKSFARSTCYIYKRFLEVLQYFNILYFRYFLEFLSTRSTLHLQHRKICHKMHPLQDNGSFIELGYSVIFSDLLCVANLVNRHRYRARNCALSLDALE